MTRGTFLWSFQFVFRTTEASARAILPPSLEPLTRDGQAFFNVAIGEYEGLRPATRPLKLGRGGHIAIVRLYAREKGTPDVGFYGLRAICDDARSLRYTHHLAGTPTEEEHIDVFDDTVGTVQIKIDSEFEPTSMTLDTRGKPILSPGSPFRSLTESATFLRPPSRLFALDGSGGVLTADIERI